MENKGKIMKGWRRPLVGGLITLVGGLGLSGLGGCENPNLKYINHMDTYLTKNYPDVEEKKIDGFLLVYRSVQGLPKKEFDNLVEEFSGDKIIEAYGPKTKEEMQKRVPWVIGGKLHNMDKAVIMYLLKLREVAETAQHFRE